MISNSKEFLIRDFAVGYLLEDNSVIGMKICCGAFGKA